MQEIFWHVYLRYLVYYIVTMYKRPNSKKETIRLAGIYTIMTVSVAVIVTLLVMMVLNYRFNSATGTLEQRGLIQFASTPSGAMITVDGQILSARTPAKSSVEPGDHTVQITREGYRAWQKTQSVAAGSLVWLNYARLVPESLPVESIKTFSTVTASLSSPSNELILVQEKNDTPAFQLINIAKDTPEVKTVTLPSALYAGDDSASTPPVITPVRWDPGSRYVLVKVAVGDTLSWIVFDTQQPDRSRNITKELSISVTDARFAGNSGAVLYVISDATLRKVDLSAGTLSRALVSNVATVNLYDPSTVLYTTIPVAESNVRSAGVYREGDTAPIPLVESQKPVSIALESYYNITYIALSAGDTLTVYKGDYSKGIDALTKVTTQSTDAAISSVEFNADRSRIFVRADREYAAYDIEHDHFVTSELQGDQKSTQLHWLDSMNVWSIDGDTVVMRELDGTNQQTIMSAKQGQMVTLSRNGTYMYAIGTRDDGTAQLQRVRMILK